MDKSQNQTVLDAVKTFFKRLVCIHDFRYIGSELFPVSRLDGKPLVVRVTKECRHCEKIKITVKIQKNN